MKHVQYKQVGVGWQWPSMH